MRVEKKGAREKDEKVVLLAPHLLVLLVLSPNRFWRFHSSFRPGSITHPSPLQKLLVPTVVEEQ